MIERDTNRATVAARQTESIRELQTPVMQIWDGILALPIIGSLDTARTQEMSEALLDKVMATGAEIVLLDISGTPVVDTAVSRHLLEMVAAARLLGAEVMIVGMSPQVAITLVHLGIDLSGIVTRTTMARGLELAFARLDLDVVPVQDR